MHFVCRHRVLVILVKIMESVFQITTIISTIVTVPWGTKEFTAKQVNLRILIKCLLSLLSCVLM